MGDERKAGRFSDIVLPHLHAAYRLARWLTRSHEDAQDIVQQAYLSAFKAFADYRGGDAKHWILAIVRNASHTWLRQHSRDALYEEFDETVHGGNDAVAGVAPAQSDDPEALLLLREDRERIGSEIERLPLAFREVLVLREFEALSYREIAVLVGIPIGTVMSRLARARRMLLTRLRDGGP